MPRTKSLYYGHWQTLHSNDRYERRNLNRGGQDLLAEGGSSQGTRCKQTSWYWVQVNDPLQVGWVCPQKHYYLVCASGGVCVHTHAHTEKYVGLGIYNLGTYSMDLFSRKQLIMVCHLGTCVLITVTLWLDDAYGDNIPTWRLHGDCCVTSNKDSFHVEV